MNFEGFQTNVHGWGEDRGIYEHSTILAQALKGVSECGELADALIKGDQDEVEDGIGDTAVCLVHVAHMTGIDLESMVDHPDTEFSDQAICAFLSRAVGSVAFIVSILECGAGEAGGEVMTELGEEIWEALGCLAALATKRSLTFSGCCEAAWNAIKDRKGRMVAGGAFVKDEVATAETMA